ncbi:coenzyme F420-0:L-glutamate ligase [Halomarina salina]|uniref:Coenzyme F420-0:L-glutamate ligase n=1 Tax=Halomarina salina TaxID=1872699 RepID=A0ABD5RJS8_9EURY|nr:coenzyme F420-0:L-glutamate ligase [Halomarina salina]
MELFALADVPEIREGGDLAAVVEERVDLRADDVLCVASTVVSKAEGRTVDLDDVTASDRARAIAQRLEDVTGEAKDPRFAQVVLDESTDLVTEAPFLLTETHFGHVTVNAGIDRSNVPEADLLLLPEDPSGSAARLHEELGVPVVVTDTCGRPFRHGQRGVTIGWAGMSASRDWRGETDRDGRELGVTVESVVDELAAASNLLTGEGDGGTPLVVVRGFEFGDHDGSDNLFREYDDDLIRQALQAWEFPG